MRKLLWGSGAVLAVLLVACLFTVVRESVAPTPSCACDVPVQREYRVWLADAHTGALHETRVRANAVPDVPRMTVQVLIDGGGSHPGDGLVNQWREASRTQDRPRVLSVTHRDGVVRVDLDRQVWAVPDAQVFSITPSGGVAMQQLVRTAGAALHTGDPVLLTVNGVPARGVLRYPLHGPVGLARPLIRK